MTQTATARKPSPAPDELTRPYWDAAAHGRLEIQRCRGCKRYHHPPTSMCFECGSEDLGFEPVSGHGTIYTYTITHDARNPAFAAIQPYAIVWVELDEQPRLRIVANMPGTPTGDLRIGAPVEVFFEDLTPSLALPQFRLVAELF
jgi:uncharacterized protein